jgi:hypothetical protein
MRATLATPYGRRVPYDHSQQERDGMTDQEKNQEGAEESIEDLEAPAETQGDVAGGACSKTMQCITPTCIGTCSNKTAGGGCNNKLTNIVVQVQ